MTADLGRSGRAFLAVAACAVLWTAAAGVARAWCPMTTETDLREPETECDESGIPLRWERSCVSYSVDERGSIHFPLEETLAIVDTSFQTWMDVRCDGEPTDFQVQRTEGLAMCTRPEYNSDEGNVNTVAFVGDWEERGYAENAYALTTVWHNVRTGQIYDADIVVNDSAGVFAQCPAPEGCTDGRIDLQNVLTHEVGHFFGIDHSEYVTAAMFWTSLAGEVQKRILRTDDVEGFCATYPPGSLPVECDFTPRHGLELDCSEGCCSAAPGAPRHGRGWTVTLAVGLLALARWRRRRARCPIPTTRGPRG